MATTTQKNFSIKDAIVYGLSAYGRNFLVMLGVTFISMLYFLAAPALGYSIYQIWGLFMPHTANLMQVFSHPELAKQFFTDLQANPRDLLALVISFFATVIAGFLLASAAQGGLINVALKIYERGTAQLSDFFISCSQYWRYLKLSLLLFLILMAGFLLFVIPGLIFLMMYFFSMFIVFDTNISATAALHESKVITKGVRWKLFFTIIIITVLSAAIGLLAGLILPFGISHAVQYIFTPIAMLIYVYLYKKLKAQTYEHARA